MNNKTTAVLYIVLSMVIATLIISFVAIDRNAREIAHSAAAANQRASELEARFIAQSETVSALQSELARLRAEMLSHQGSLASTSESVDALRKQLNDNQNRASQLATNGQELARAVQDVEISLRNSLTVSEVVRKEWLTILPKLGFRVVNKDGMTLIEQVSGDSVLPDEKPLRP